MIEDDIKKAAEAGAIAGVNRALCSDEGRSYLRAIIREALAEIVPTLMRPEEVARRYGIPISSQRRYIREGRLRATKIGRTVLIDVSQLRPLSGEEIAAAALAARKQPRKR